MDGNPALPNCRGHADDFKNKFGVTRENIPFFLKKVITEGSLISSRTNKIGNGRVGIERIFKYKGKYFLLTAIGTNGFIISAYPIRKVGKE